MRWLRAKKDFEQIKKVVDDPTWQKLRESLSWTKENIGSSLRKLHKYLGDNPSRQKKVRVLNLLNAVARGGLDNAPLRNWQERLRKELEVGKYKKAWLKKAMDKEEIKRVIEEAGGLIPLFGMDPDEGEYVIFTEPETKSSIGIYVHEFTPELLQQRIEQKRQLFKRYENKGG